MYQSPGNSFLPGALIGGVWEVECPLGKGGMGSVYRCHNRHAGRIKAAIKLLDPAFQFHPEAKARFLREAEILFTIEHPNVVKVSNVHLNASPPFLEMEYIDGESLENELAQNGAVPLPVALDRCSKLAHAVAYLHRKGIFHRDIKPDNILVRAEDGEPKIVDFGLAMERGARRITQAGQQHFGTVSYCPPEWMQAETVDPIAWDAYALGVVMYEMLTGTVGFPMSRTEDARRQVIMVMTQKQKVEHLDPGTQFQPELRDLVRRMTTRERKSRLVDAAEVVRIIATLDPEWEPTEGATDGFAMIPDPTPTERERVEAPTVYGAAGNSQPPGRSISMLVAVAGLAFAIGGGLAIAAGIALLIQTLAPAPRDVTLRVAGIDASWPISITIEDQLAMEVDGIRHRFVGVPIGEVYTRWAIGEGCDAMLETLPNTCQTGSKVLQVEAGEGEANLFLELEAPHLRAVTIKTAAAPGTVTMGGRTLSLGPDGSVTFEGLRPGNYEAEIRVGVCPDGCTGEACGPSCSQSKHPVEVSVGEGRLEARFKVSPPVPTALEVVPAPVLEPRPTPAPVVPVPVMPTAPPSRVSADRFATWLDGHPDWAPEKARADGRAEASYLDGVAGGRPSGGGAMVAVPYAAAVAFCTGSGGLRGIEDEPLTWAGSPLHEWRVGATGTPMWRRFDGATSHRVRPSEANMQTGFRCAR